MKLGGYGSSRQVRVPVWVAVGLGLIWAVVTLNSFFSDTEASWEGSENGYLLYADREMRMLDAGARGSALMRWYLEADERKRVVGDLARSFDAAAEDGILSGSGDLVRATLHWELGDLEKAREVAGGIPVAKSDSMHALYNLLIMTNIYVAYQWPW